jgi:hypothetical protein
VNNTNTITEKADAGQNSAVWFSIRPAGEQFVVIVHERFVEERTMFRAGGPVETESQMGTGTYRTREAAGADGAAFVARVKANRAAR